MALGFSVQNAVKYGNIERISEWVDTHPDPNDVSHFLLVAAEDATESTEVVELLIGAGADPNFTKEVDLAPFMTSLITRIRSGCGPVGTGLQTRLA
ncbi:MAG TPA: hypothetical protein VET85_10570 [Stellaceae bacterium]|nr:hypothetical protein [Stellaceae bacterium]